MIVKQINTTISLVSKVLQFAIFLYFAALLAKLVWWVVTPSTSDIYLEPLNVSAFNNSAKFIINRSPFGIAVAPPPPPKPMIASEIKLTGLYLSTPKNSIVFYELNNKSYIAKVGDTIGGNAVIKSVRARGIVITENNVDADVDMVGGVARVADISRNPPYNSNSGGGDNFLNNGFGNSAGGNLQQNQRYHSSDQSSIFQERRNDYNLPEKRRRIIDEYIAQYKESENNNARSYDN